MSHASPLSARAERLPGTLWEHLERFERFGLSRPPSMSLGEYLHRLAEEQAIPRETAARSADLFHRSRYGHESCDPRELDDVRQALARAVAELEARDAIDRQSLAESWRERFIPSETTRPAPEERGQGARRSVTGKSTVPARPVSGEDRSASSTDPTAGPWWLRWSTVSVAFVLWTVVVGVGAYWGRGTIGDRSRKQNVPQQVAPSAAPRSQASVDSRRSMIARLEEFRTSVRDHEPGPEQSRILVGLARLHVRHGQYAQALHAFQMAAVRTPGDAHLLNDFALLLLTSEDRWYRDPLYALDLAERSFEMKRKYYVADTVAEAHYQNGDFEQALAYAESALELLRAEPDFDEKRQAESVAILDTRIAVFRKAAAEAAEDAALRPVIDDSDRPAPVRRPWRSISR